jgi:hypothetical protein
MFRRRRSGDLGVRMNWRKGVKKKGRQLRRCLTERSTDVSFPKKGRQIFVSPPSGGMFARFFSENIQRIVFQKMLFILTVYEYSPNR